MDGRKISPDTENPEGNHSLSDLPEGGRDHYLKCIKDSQSLVEKCGKLDHELEESQKKWESDTKKMLLDFIEVADAYENMLRNVESRIDALDKKSKEWLGHFRTVFKLLQRSLKYAGVTPIETMIGEKANPHWHTVVEVAKQPDRENETIVEVIKKGYLWGEKLLRAAEVKAVKNI